MMMTGSSTHGDGFLPSGLLVGESRGQFASSLESSLSQSHVLLQLLLLGDAVVEGLLQRGDLLFDTRQSLLFLL